MHPAVQATTRTPGPSTADPVVKEWRNPMSPRRERRPDVGLRNVPPEIHAQLERARSLRACVIGGGGVRSARSDMARHAPWNVRLMTSICCSRVSRTKFTA